jgi:hypothetical protein
MATPSQDKIVCKGCGEEKEPHPKRRLYCVICTNKLHVAYTSKHRAKLKSVPRKVACKGCGKEFDASERGRTWRCHECTLEYQRAQASKDKERHREYSRKYRANLGQEYRDRLIVRRKELISGMNAEQLAAFRLKEAEKSARLNAVLKLQVFEAYGGFKCACCGETEPLFLSIDHIDNNGSEMRRNGIHGRSGTQFYQWLRKNGFPDGFQVLCMNCNVGKHRNGGVCPHQSSKA